MQQYTVLFVAQFVSMILPWISTYFSSSFLREAVGPLFPLIGLRALRLLPPVFFEFVASAKRAHFML